MVTWRKDGRWVRYINGQMVALSVSDVGIGTYTDAITPANGRLSIADLTNWARQEFPSIPTRKLQLDDDLIGITIATFV